MNKDASIFSGLLLLSVCLAFCHQLPDPEMTLPPPDESLLDPCGNVYEASNRLASVTGIYSGQKSHDGIYSDVTFKVCLVPSAANKLRIDDDTVTMDTTRLCSANPSISGYRWYQAKFRNDSLFLYTDTGWLNQPNSTWYVLKKQ